MAHRRRHGWTKRLAFTAAMFAVALLNLAATKSVVMQAAGDMPAMASVLCSSAHAVHASPRGGTQPEKTQKVCDYCAAAAHAPLCDAAAATPQSAVLTWTAYAALEPLGPRGPPAFSANARGPPQTSLTI